VIFLSLATATATAAFTVLVDVVELDALPAHAPPVCTVSPIEARQHSPPARSPLPARAPPGFSAA